MYTLTLSVANPLMVMGVGVSAVLCVCIMGTYIHEYVQTRA